jgi:hypothetical protein
LHTKFAALLAVFLLFAVPARCGHTLGPRQQEILNNWLTHHAGFRAAVDADCDCRGDIEAKRTQPVGRWKAAPDYHPYIATGDFNGDGAEDFAAVVIDGSARKDRYTLLVFNGPFDSDAVLPAFVASHLSLKYRGFAFGPPRPKPYRLIVGPFESDNTAMLVPLGRGYKLE